MTIDSRYFRVIGGDGQEYRARIEDGQLVVARADPGKGPTRIWQAACPPTCQLPDDGIAIPVDVARAFNGQIAGGAEPVMRQQLMPNAFMLPVLVVHDDVETTVVAQHVLSTAGLNVLIAMNVRDALERLSEHEFAAIVLREHLPDGDTSHVVSAAKSRTRPIPVILMAEKDAEPFGTALLNRNADDYVRESDASFMEQLVARINHVTQVAEREQDLRRARQLFGMIADAASEVLTVADGAGNIAYVSAGSRQLLGYAPHELIGTRGIDLVHPDDRARMVLVRRNPSDEQVLTSYRCRRKDGAYVWLEVRAKVVRHPETGAISEVLGLSRDISDRVRMINQLQLITDATPDGFMLVDPNGQTAMVNAEVERLFGYSRGELLGVPIKDVVRSLFRPSSSRAEQGGRQSEAGDAPDLLERATGRKEAWVGLHRNGRAIPVAVIGRRIRTAEGTYSLFTIADETGHGRIMRSVSSIWRRARAHSRRRRPARTER